MTPGGRRPVIAVTRQAGDGEVLAAEIIRRGGVPIGTPLTRTVSLDATPLRTAIERAVPGTWLVCTSRRAVSALDGLRLDRATRDRLLLACVGEGTTAAAVRSGWVVAVSPEEADGEHLALAMLSHRPPGAVVFPCAREAHDALPVTLRNAGCQVEAIPCYATEPDLTGVSALHDLLQRDAVDVVTLSAGSAARALAAGVPALERGRAAFVTIGRTTAAEAIACGLAVSGVATHPTPAALAEVAMAVARTIADTPQPTTA